MPYALVVQPQLVSILDFHGNPTDVWVVEAPSWLAKFLSESSLNEENQIEAEPQRIPLYYAPRSNGCKVREIVDQQEEHLPLVQGNNYQDDSLNSLTDEGFCQVFSNSDSSSSSSPNTSQEIILNESYSLYEDPCIVHVQAFDDFVPATPLYQSSFLSLSPYPMYEQQQFQQQPYFYNSMMPPPIPYSHSQSVYNHHQMKFQQNSIPPPSSEALLGDYLPIPAQKPEMTAPDPFSLQTCNGAYLISNKSNKVSGFISFSNQELGFSHPLGQVFKTQGSVKFNFLLESGKTCYVKAFPHCIKFSSNLNGVAYVIDEAGVRTCWESFNDLEPEVTQSMWKRDCGLGVKIAGRSQTSSIRHQRFASQQKRTDPPTGTITDLTVPEGESVEIKRKGMRIYSETRELSNITLSTYNFSITSALNKGSGSGIGHIQVRCSRHRFRQSVIFDGKSLKVKFHTQFASLGKDGKLSLSK